MMKVNDPSRQTNQTRTHSYQDAVAMGTHSSSEPLMGLELNLSVHVIDIKISITWKDTEEKNIFQSCVTE